ncbi:HpcH/HpaI aldolase/citrate lyase family protein [Citricoccus zhacaiensis]
MKDICTWLYTPASSTDKLEKALTRGADAVIYDLEDAVHPDRKEFALSALVEFLAHRPDTPDTSVFVRINPLDSPWSAREIEELADVRGLEGIRIPKVELPSQLEGIRRTLPGVRLQALVETASGVASIQDLCASDAVDSVSLGDNDLRAGLKLGHDMVLDQIRGRLVIAHAAAGKAAPNGSVYPRIKDLDGLREDSLHLKGLGFYGRSVLHPSQIHVVQDAFRPDQQEIEWAEEVVEADRSSSMEGVGAVMLANGQFVDKPFVDKAREILRRAGS